MLNLGVPELLLILLVLVVLFGAGRVADYAKSLGTGLRGLQEGFVDARGVREVDVTAAEDPLVVFVSSRADELRAEREAARTAVTQIPILRPWLFEFTPPASDELETSYIVKVENCDIFVLIVGETLSAPVIHEYETAVARMKPILVFVKDCARSPEAQAFVASIATKLAAFSSAAGLAHLMRLAIVDELIKGYREGRRRSVSRSDFAVLLALQQTLTSEGADDSKETVNRYVDLATAMMKKFEFSKALNLTTAATFLDPANAQAFFIRGRCHNYFGDLDAARSDYIRGLEISPDDLKGMLEYGFVRYNRREIDQAIALANKAILGYEKAHLNSHRAYYLRGIGRARERDDRSKTKASRDVKKALRLIELEKRRHPLDHDLHLHRAEALAELDRLQEAIEELEVYLGRESRDAHAYCLFGALTDIVGRDQEAIAAFEKCVRLGPHLWMSFSEEALSRIRRTSV